MRSDSGRRADQPTGHQARLTVFAFFGHPGAGKTTLCRRLGELAGIPAVDTDAFMTLGEVAAVEAGRYTREMRLANIQRYAAHVKRLLNEHPAVGIADGLPDDQAREFLRTRLADGEIPPGVEVTGTATGMRRPARGMTRPAVVFVLVRTPRALWERRLASREGAAVSIGVAAADAYVREHWRDPPSLFAHEVLVNVDDLQETDAALMALYGRHVPPP